MLDITNNMRGTLIFDKRTTIGILDLRSLGYYKIFTFSYVMMLRFVTTSLNLEDSNYYKHAQCILIFYFCYVWWCGGKCIYIIVSYIFSYE